MWFLQCRTNIKNTSTSLLQTDNKNEMEKFNDIIKEYKKGFKHT